ncbi:MAG: hypothetical protein ACKVPJ_08630 [Chitinophagales bacterium]
MRGSSSAESKFTLEHDIADVGKKFNGFFRWKNTTDKSKSGPRSLRGIEKTG